VCSLVGAATQVLEVAKQIVSADRGWLWIVHGVSCPLFLFNEVLCKVIQLCWNNPARPFTLRS